jgi:hypothetical protein
MCPRTLPEGEQDLGATERSLAVEHRVLARWLQAFVDAEKFDAKFGLQLPGDSALASMLNGAEEALWWFSKTGSEPQDSPQKDSSDSLGDWRGAA